MSYVVGLNLVNLHSLFPCPYFVNRDMTLDMDGSLVLTILHQESKDSI